MTDLAQSVEISTRTPGRARLLAFLGPAAMVSVGYMDPGNWATDLEGGARFGYELLWLLLASNLIALLLQGMAARLGVVAGRDLAQACREYYAEPVAIALWALAELAIVACDLAEVLGSAIALNLLFGLPLVWGALITSLDVMLILALQAYGVRKLEAVVAAMVLTIGACFAFELLLARPDWGEVARGVVPRLDTASLYVAVGILGATVMPHNLYLHSALVRTRRIGASISAKREALRYNQIDTAVGLNLALLINAAILVLAATTFFRHGVAVTELAQAHELLTPLLGTSAAAAVFAIALLASGQSSTITGTLAGQYVMEGFLRIRLSPVVRRLATRGLAVVPAVAVLTAYGGAGLLQLLVLSQVVLSLQLPFAVIPLVRFTASRRLLGVLANPRWVTLLGWSAAALIIALNLWLAVRALAGWAGAAPAAVLAAGVLAAGALAAAGVALLAWIAFAPLGRADRV